MVRFQFQPKKGQPATDLVPADIEIREDGVPQPIVLFEGGRSRARTLPVHVDLLFDCERSALAGVPLEPEMLQENLLNAHENVAIGIYGFSGAAVRLTAPTRDPARLKKALDAAVFPRAATTFLFDHIQTVVLDAATAGPAIRMLVVFSSAQPGLGGGPRSSERELFAPTVRIAQESGVTVYPVLLRLPFGSQASDSNTTTSASAGGSSRNTMTEYSPDQSILRSVGDFKNLGSATGDTARRLSATPISCRGPEVDLEADPGRLRRRFQSIPNRRREAPQNRSRVARQESRQAGWRLHHRGALARADAQWARMNPARESRVWR